MHNKNSYKGKSCRSPGWFFKHDLQDNTCYFNLVRHDVGFHEDLRKKVKKKIKNFVF